MTIAAVLRAHLPPLRRFARALAGSQSAGDAAVERLLQTLVADPAPFPQGLEPRVALYRSFLKLLAGANAGAPAEKRSAFGFERNISALTPLSRQAFLLRHVEGFGLGDTATILDTSDAEVRRLIEKAGEEIARQVATDALVIEDEPLIAMDLTHILEELGHRVVSVARTREEARRIAADHRLGLVLADIQLADGSSGIDAVNDLLGAMEVPVIFITAYPEKLLTGEKPEPTFLITKPYLPDTLRITICQALFFDQRSRRAA
jgi:DNA-directed RNA polymerase specialized sigma24 family protein